ncbi:hypothetical protein [Flavobacterium sp. ASW18X]|uniref:hypothetical protein n=1 Tax=Flavobacterium sp. ASW18X TaxID=2572595 RepID=UPI0010ADA6B5|nr:hypothetical protein [Flavobacterium sp. ASW18X]TKD62509.1 hypothetical protein FBT53_09755 [Flavobacterium sp. ASW18X]
MKNLYHYSAICMFIFGLVSCQEDDLNVNEAIAQNRDIQITNQVVSTNFIGNGVQWGGYDMVPTWLGTETLSEEDWSTLFARIDFLRPPFLRIMTSPSWSYEVNGAYDEQSKTASLYRMLDYAQAKGIEVTFGEWGHVYDGDISNINGQWVANSVKFVNHLINEKGYTVIKTVNIVNEPNGDWSSTNGNYNVWRDVQLMYLAEMEKYNLASVKLMGPDIAIFNSAAQTEWFTNATVDLGDNLGLYDIHVYPEQTTVRSGEYAKMLRAYKTITPADKPLVLGEIGFKYANVDAALKAKNDAAIAEDAFAGQDSNMMVYQAFYGVDMADALIQTMREGYAGSIIWNMDDAMYNSPDDGDYHTQKLKRWGFWNILGEELGGKAEDEMIRPFFYPVSLLSRFFPAGSTLYQVNLPDKKGVRAIMGEKDGKYTIALVNSHYVSYPINLKSNDLESISVAKYSYKANQDGSFIGAVDLNGFAIPETENIALNLKEGVTIELEGQSFVLFTNME